jgi:hypothetical protein
MRSISPRRVEFVRRARIIYVADRGAAAGAAVRLHPEAKRMRPLEDEIARLKKLLAEQMLDAATLRELSSKNGRTRRPSAPRLRIYRLVWAIGAAGLFDRRRGPEDDPLLLSPGTER